MQRGKINKKGLSTIIVTVILVAISLAAVAIVWAVVSGTLRFNSEDIDLTSKCLNVEVTANSVSCSGSPLSCVVQLQRGGSGNYVIGGVRMVFKNSTQGASQVLDFPGNIEPLAVNTTTVLPGIPAPDLLETTVYFYDDSGDARNCPEPSPFEF